jgi:hypothetical protein
MGVDCLHALLRRAAPAAIAAVTLSVSGGAQDWNSSRARELAERAVARRNTQISTAGVIAYSAEARGYLTFLGQIGDTALLPPKVIKQTQLAVNVYWRAPAFSKQIVVGMRDTTLLPADIDYYSDRFGIVQSNFPDRIRMGDGQDVSDVVHPLAGAGLDLYDYAVTDSLSIMLPSERIDVYRLSFRPRDPRAPRVIGSAYLDVRDAAIVRLEISFTRAAILDPRIEILSVALENALVEGRAWLPRRQTLEVVRTGTWMKIEGRGIIRGRWDVCCYDVTFAPEPVFFQGPPIVFAPPNVLRAFAFEGGILDALPPEQAVARPEDLQTVQMQAEALVAAEFRERVEGATLAMPRLSELVRVTRAEGVALGLAGHAQPWPQFAVDGRLRYGFADRTWKGEISFGQRFDGGRAVSAYVMRDYREVRDVPEVSGVRNTLAAQEFGADNTDPIDVRALGVKATLGRALRVRWRTDAAIERHAGLTLRATPEHGQYAALIPAQRTYAVRASVSGDGAAWAVAGGALRAGWELRLSRFWWRDAYRANAARVFGDIEFERRLGERGGMVMTRTLGGGVSGGAVPPQMYIYFGGPTTAPGYSFTDFAARRGISQHIEWRREVPFVPLPLGRFGRVPPHATLAPYAHVVWVDGPARSLTDGMMDAHPFRADRQGWYPALGVAIEPILGVIRVETARGLRDGRWTFSMDIARLFWPIM